MQELIDYTLQQDMQEIMNRIDNADLETKNICLVYAAGIGNAEIVQLFIKVGADILYNDHQPILTAAANGNHHLFDILNPVHSLIPNLITVACQGNYCETVEFIIENYPYAEFDLYQGFFQSCYNGFRELILTMSKHCQAKYKEFQCLYNKGLYDIIPILFSSLQKDLQVQLITKAAQTKCSALQTIFNQTLISKEMNEEICNRK